MSQLKTPTALFVLATLFWSCGSEPRPRLAGLTVQSPFSSHATLRWSPFPGAEAYRVSRAWGVLPLLTRQDGVDQAFFEDDQLRPGSEYRYRVAALAGGREIAQSEVLSIRPPVRVVSGLRASWCSEGVLVQWTPLSGVSKYWLTRITEGAASPAVHHLLDGEEALLGRWTDTESVPGRVSAYYLEPVSDGRDTDGTVAFSSLAVPGAAQDLGPAPSPPLGDVSEIRLGARAFPGSVELVWSSGGPGAVYSVRRQIGTEKPTVLAEGLLGTSFLDRTLPPGNAARYRIAVARSTSATRESGDTAVVGIPALPRRIESGRLTFDLDDYPSQSVGFHRLEGMPIRGVFFLVGQSPSDVPHLVDAVLDSGWVVLDFPPFQFGTEAKPRYLATFDDPEHLLLPIDIRWPALGSLFLSKALEQLGQHWPDHPELKDAPVAGWGFSQAAMSLAEVLSRPEWKARTATLVYADAVEPDFSMPISRLAGVPQLFFVGGRDSFSRLSDRFFPWSAGTRGQYIAHQIEMDRWPLTVVNNEGAFHGERLDDPFVARWLGAVLDQRFAAPEISWQGSTGWTSGYRLEVITDPPLGTAKEPSVRIVGRQAQEGNPREGRWNWFPSRELAEAWSH